MRTRFDFLEYLELCNDSWYGLIIVLVFYRHISKDSACMLDLVKSRQIIGHETDTGMLIKKIESGLLASLSSMDYRYNRIRIVL